jgi:hypothetical protein
MISRNINHMPAVKFFMRLDLEQICHFWTGTIYMIDEAVANGARLSKACDALGLSQRTIQR